MNAFSIFWVVSLVLLLICSNDRVLQITTDDPLYQEHSLYRFLYNITYDFYGKHTHSYSGDAGIDLFVLENITVPARAFNFVIPLNVSILMIEKYLLYSVNRSYYLYPRSSLSKTPLRLSNGIGIIDSGFTGKLSVLVDNFSDQPYLVTRGTRLVQVCHPSLRSLSVSLNRVGSDYGIVFIAIIILYYLLGPEQFFYLMINLAIVTFINSRISQDQPVRGDRGLGSTNY